MVTAAGDFGGGEGASIIYRVSIFNKCDEAERSLIAESCQRVFNTELPESIGDRV